MPLVVLSKSEFSSCCSGSSSSRPAPQGKTHSTDTLLKWLTSSCSPTPVFLCRMCWSSAIMGSSPQTLITERKLSSRECELAGLARLSPLLEPSNTVKGAGVGGRNNRRKKKHIRPSHSALLPGGTFGLCGEVSALYSQQTFNAQGPQWRGHLLPWQIQSGCPVFVVGFFLCKERLCLVSEKKSEKL